MFCFMQRSFHLLQWHLHVHLVVEKGMLQSSLSTDTTFGVSFKHFDQQIKSRRWYLRIALFSKGKITCPILGQNLVILLALENRSPKQ